MRCKSWCGVIACYASRHWFWAMSACKIHTLQKAIINVLSTHAEISSLSCRLEADGAISD